MKTLHAKITLATLLCLTALAWWSVSYQIKESRVLYYDVSSGQRWAKDHLVHFDWGHFGHAYAEGLHDKKFRFPPRSSFDPTLVADLPEQWGGFHMYVTIHDNYDAFSPKINVFCGEQELQTLKLENATRAMENSIVWRIPIDSARLQTGTDIRFANQRQQWFCEIVRVPNIPLDRAMKFFLPLLPLLFLFIATRYTLRPLPSALLLVAVTYPLFSHTYFFAKLMPMQGLFHTDARDIVRALMTANFSSDMAKHPLLLPLLNSFKALLHALHVTDKPYRALFYAFMFISSLNIAAAWHLLSRTTWPAMLRALTLLAYLFSFAVLTYSSIYESFVLTSLLCTVVLIMALRYRDAPGRLHYALLVASCVAACLASLTAGVFVLLAAWLSIPPSGETHARIVWPKLGRSLCSLLVCTGIGAGLVLIAILSTYLGDMALDERFTYFFNALLNAHADYATAHGSTWLDKAATMGSFLFESLLNVDTAIAAHQDETIPLLALRTGRAIGWLTILLLVGGAAVGCIRSRETTQQAMFVCLLALAPYFLFHLDFNPGEMILYASPVMLLLLLGIVAAAVKGLGEKTVTALLGVLVVVQIFTSILS